MSLLFPAVCSSYFLKTSLSDVDSFLGSNKKISQRAKSKMLNQHISQSKTYITSFYIPNVEVFLVPRLVLVTKIDDYLIITILELEVYS